MADKRISDLTATTSPIGADLLPIVTDVAGVATTKKVTLGNLTKAFSFTVSNDGSGGYNCDGVADEVQINLAIVAANAAGGGIVFIKAGEYVIASPILMLSNVQVIGEGYGTQISMVAGADCHGFYAVTKDNIAVKDLYFDGSNATTPHFFNYFQDCDNVIIERCFIYACDSDGIHIRVGGGKTFVRNNWVWGCGENGICDIETDNVTIEGNYVWGNGLLYSGGSGLLLRHDSGHVSYINVKNNYFFDNTQIGIYAQAGSHINIEGNYCYSNDNAGIVLGTNGYTNFGCKKSTIVNNHCNNNSATGIQVDSSSDIIVTGNMCMNNGQDAVLVIRLRDGIHLSCASHDCERITISGNDCSDDQGVGVTQQYGIILSTYFGASSFTDINIIDNITVDNETAGVLAQGTNTAVVVKDNNGYNPVGVSAITVTASPFTYTAGASPETVYISGGTVNPIVKGGVTLFVNTGHSVELSPLQSVVVTYSGAPTMNKDIH